MKYKMLEVFGVNWQNDDIGDADDVIDGRADDHVVAML